MEQTASTIKRDRAGILDAVVRILEHMTSDWDLELERGIGPDTLLIADLNCESLDVVSFVVAIQVHFGRRDLPFERLLMTEGRYVDDLRVADVVDFLYERLNP